VWQAQPSEKFTRGLNRPVPQARVLLQTIHLPRKLHPQQTLQNLHLRIETVTLRPSAQPQTDPLTHNTNSTRPN
jgi:hypothetical protein